MARAGTQYGIDLAQPLAYAVRITDLRIADDALAYTGGVRYL